MGSRFRVHPLVVIFAILAGGEIHGITGMLIAIPLIPLIKETWLFFRPRLQFEGWCAAVTGARERRRAAALRGLAPAPRTTHPRPPDPRSARGASPGHARRPVSSRVLAGRPIRP